MWEKDICGMLNPHFGQYKFAAPAASVAKFFRLIQ